jgi:hypothetical protein
MNDNSNESPTSEGGPRQIYAPTRIEIVRFGGGAGGNAQTDVTVRIWTPDARLLQKLSLVAAPSPDSSSKFGAAVVGGRGLLAWWYTVEDDQAAGRAGTPVNDLFGTAAAPLPFPDNAGLGGQGRDIKTAADGVGVRLRVPVQGAGGVKGSVYAQARFQPSEFGLVPWSQWDEIRRQCKIDIVAGDVIKVP